MLRSKATAALMRLKEMDKKYNIKRNEGKPVLTNFSTDSSLEDSPRKLSVEFEREKEVRHQMLKPKMEIKIPIVQTNDSSLSNSVTSKAPPKPVSISENNKKEEIEESTRVSMTKDSPKSISTLETISEVKVKDLPRNNESSVTTILSVRSDGSDVIPEAIDDEQSSGKDDRKSNVPEVTEVSVPVSNTDNNETTIEEAVESISELSNADNASSREEQKIQYEDDTFEEATTSSRSSIGVKRESSEEDTVIPGVKQIKITRHKQADSIEKIVVDEEREKKIVELVPPKVMQSTSECDVGLDEDLLNYVKTTENVEEAGPISLLKLSKQITPKKNVRKGKRHRKSSNENTEAKTDSSEHVEHKENSTEANVVGGNVSSASTKSGSKSHKQTSPSAEANKEKYNEKIQEQKSKIEIREPETISSEEKFLREIPIKSDVTSTLRKLNKDAINAIVRRHRVHTSEKVSNKQCKNCGTKVTLPLAEGFKNIEDDSDASSVENTKTLKGARIRAKSSKSKKASRSSKRKSNYSKVEGKQSRFDCRQTNRLRKNAVEIRLQQEREDIRNYLIELERTRLEYGPGEPAIPSQISAFKQLEFPKIAAFVRPDSGDTRFEDKDEIARLQERILTIRQWLKDQYILYRDYSSLAQTINSKYIPVSLEDAKRTIRQLQRATIKNR